MALFHIIAFEYLRALQSLLSVSDDTKIILLTSITKKRLV